MTCPKCRKENNGVVDSRKKGDGLIWRRRNCRECGQRWNTIELPEYWLSGGGLNGIIKDAGRDTGHREPVRGD